MRWAQWICGVLFLSSALAACNRKPPGASGDRSPVDENFRVLIEGNPETFIPGQPYNISLSCAGELRFISFTLVVESENSAGPGIGYDMAGHFDIIDGAESKFSTSCENMLESTNTNAKTRIDVAWVAPTNPESGCVLIKAAVLQHRNVWFVDDGFLTKRICPEEIDDMNSQSPPVNPCCACDEAKYEIILERKWTRNTHAKDYPVEALRTRLSELIGASHTFDYRFWAYGSLASRGLREMAEHGATQTLEMEIKANSEEVRTIIKAPGIIHRQNVIGTTLANVRVDPQHHLVSLVSKIDPSPDWILGVAGLELCLANCTWAERKELNLYPWDVGTDAGPSYMSPDQPQVPPDVVRRITSTFPSDYRSPFYDKSGAPMKPLATLYLTRKKLYERECSEDGDVSLECVTHPWNPWSECSMKCGPGTQTRSRAYKDPRLAKSFNCELVLSQTQSCVGEQCGMQEEGLEVDSRVPSAECELRPWSGWSRCSNNCGKGYTTRTRDYMNTYAREKCQSALPMDLEENRPCVGDDCGGQIQRNDEEDVPEQQYGGGAEIEEAEENPYENTRFPTSRRRPSLETFGGNERKPYEPARDDIEENPYGQGKPEDTYGSNFQRNRYTQNRFSNQANMEEEEQDTGDINSDPDSPYSNYDNSRGYSPQNQFQPSNNIGNRNPQNNRYDNTPTRFPSNYNAVKPFKEKYDEFGRKAIVVEGDPNNYDVVQEYCYEKPAPSFRRCKSPKENKKNAWFYDHDDRMCKLYTPDSCDQNKNKFGTLDACEGTCLKPQMNAQFTQDGEEEEPAGNWGNNQGFGDPESLVRQRTPTRRGPKFQNRAPSNRKTNALDEVRTEAPIFGEIGTAARNRPTGRTNVNRAEYRGMGAERRPEGGERQRGERQRQRGERQRGGREREGRERAANIIENRRQGAPVEDIRNSQNPYRAQYRNQVAGYNWPASTTNEEPQPPMRGRFQTSRMQYD